MPCRDIGMIQLCIGSHANIMPLGQKLEQRETGTKGISSCKTTMFTFWTLSKHLNLVKQKGVRKSTRVMEEISKMVYTEVLGDYTFVKR